MTGLLAEPVSINIFILNFCLAFIATSYERIIVRRKDTSASLWGCKDGGVIRVRRYAINRLGILEWQLATNHWFYGRDF